MTQKPVKPVEGHYPEFVLEGDLKRTHEVRGPRTERSK